MSTSSDTFKVFYSEPISKGGYGTVFNGITSKGRPVAVKTIKMNKRKDYVEADIREEHQKIKKEVDILVTLDGNRYFVKTFGTDVRKINNDIYYMFAMEKANGSVSNLLKMVENKYGMEMNALLDFVCDCAGAIQGLENKKIAHRDIKDYNILYFESRTKGRRRFSTFSFKFCDTGVSKEVTDVNAAELQTICGTQYNLGPEIADAYANNQPNTSEKYSAVSCDLWCLACTLYHCMTGEYSFPVSATAQRHDMCVSQLKEQKDAIAVELNQKEHGEIAYKTVTTIANTKKKYPLWLVHTMTLLIRNCFHEPNSGILYETAKAIQKAARCELFDPLQMKKILYLDLPAANHLLVDFLKTNYPTVEQEFRTDIKMRFSCLLSRSSHYELPLKEALEEGTYWIYQTTKIFCKPPEQILEFDESPSTESDTRKKDYLKETRSVLVRNGLEMEEFCNNLVWIMDQMKAIVVSQCKLTRAVLVSKTERLMISERFTRYTSVAAFSTTIFKDPNDTVSLEKLQSILQQLETDNRNIETCTKFVNDSEVMCKKLENDAKVVQLPGDSEQCFSSTESRHVANGLLGFLGKSEVDPVQNIRLNDLEGVRESLSKLADMDESEILDTTKFAHELLNMCSEMRDKLVKILFETPNLLQIFRVILRRLLDIREAASKFPDDLFLEVHFQELEKELNQFCNCKGISKEKSVDGFMRYQKLVEKEKEMKKAIKDLAETIKIWNKTNNRIQN